MAEPILDASRVVVGIGKRVAAGVPEGMAWTGEGEAGVFADALDEPVRSRIGANTPLRAYVGAVEVCSGNFTYFDTTTLKIVPVCVAHRLAQTLL
jgi:hypothetical protein